MGTAQEPRLSLSDAKKGAERRATVAGTGRRPTALTREESATKLQAAYRGQRERNKRMKEHESARVLQRTARQKSRARRRMTEFVSSAHRSKPHANMRA